MKRTLPLLLLLLICSIQPAQPEPHKQSREQTEFGVEDTFKRPVPIPAGALQALRMSKGAADLLQQCAEQEGVQAGEIPAAWFVASEIRLTQMPSAGLIVRGESACLRGAHITQFWVLTKSAPGYEIVFRGRGDGLRALPTRTNGYRDLQLVVVTQAGANIDYVKLRYSKSKYHVSGHRIDHQNQR